MCEVAGSKADLNRVARVPRVTTAIMARSMDTAACPKYEWLTGWRYMCDQTRFLCLGVVLMGKAQKDERFSDFAFPLASIGSS